MNPLRRLFRPLCLAMTPLALAASLVVGAAPGPASASSHREAPLISKDPSVDVTDVYAFVSPDAPNTVTLIANWIPFEDATGGPNFYHYDDNARYYIKVDTDGDAVEDISYRWTFTTTIRNPNTFLYNVGPISAPTADAFNYRQLYTLKEIRGSGASATVADIVVDKPMPPDNVGPRSTPNYAAIAGQAIYSGAGEFTGYKVFAGQRDDPFFVDIGSIFDLGGLRPFNQLHLVKIPAAPGIDDVGGFNIHTTAIQVPISRLAPNCPAGAISDPRCVIGVWATAERPSVTVRSAGSEAPGAGATYVQVARLGHPLINEVVVPLALKDAFNGLAPAGDAPLFNSNALFQSSVLTPELQLLLPVLYPGTFKQSGAGANLPPFPRNDLVTIFLTGIPGITAQQQSQSIPSEQLRLNVAIPPSAQGVCKGDPMGALAGDLAGYPNGRRLEDDVTDIALRAVAGGYGPVLAKPPAEGGLGLPNLSPGNLLNDGVSKNDTACLASFPYMGTPHSGYQDFHPFLTQMFMPLLFGAKGQ